MIPSKPEICPYYGKEEREKWHAERRLEDPQKSPLPIGGGKFLIGTEIVNEVPKEEAVRPQETFQENMGDINRQERERARLAAYRAANKEKLAAKARERRAKK